MITSFGLAIVNSSPETYAHPRVLQRDEERGHLVPCVASGLEPGAWKVNAVKRTITNSRTALYVSYNPVGRSPHLADKMSALLWPLDFL
jgi:hypothetical protein